MATIKIVLKKNSILTACLFLLSIQACSEKSQANKNTSAQLDTLSPKITQLDTALIDSSAILPTKLSKNNSEVDPDRPHTLN